MENYGMTLDDVYYSGDTVEMPPSYPRLIFQDHQFFEGDVNIHATYRELRDGIDPYTKSKTWLVHIGKGQEKFSPRDDGFSGFVLPGDVFYI
jgi:hypothetical protein